MNDDVILQMPGDKTIFDIDWLSIFDVESKQNFGSVIIPDALNVPPSLVQIVVRLVKYNCIVKSKITTL